MKKLIEVSMPLAAINAASSREKSIRHGHPSTLHLWWARRPLAACRAVLFGQLVDDPGEYLPPEEAEVERKRLHGIIERMVPWKNTNDEQILAEAKLEIARSIERNGGPSLGEKPTKAEVRDYLAANAPPVLDPFCGGGSIPLEAQRLGLEAHGSDLNPVAVMITKAMVEIPPQFAGQHPVNPDAQQRLSGVWKGAAGLAEDVRYYGQWMRDEAEKRIGHLYPKAKLDDGSEATVIAWLWARTVKCPNPACGAQMPLVSSFHLSKKKGKDVWVKSMINHTTKTVQFEIHTGKGEIPDGTVFRTGARCIVCESPVPFLHVRNEAKAGRMDARLMATVAESSRGQIFVSSTLDMEAMARQAEPKNVPDSDLPEKALGFRVQTYGMVKHRHLFTPRQLVALTTFSDLVSEARKQVLHDAIEAGVAEDSANSYADAVAIYLAFAVDRSTDYWSTLARWGKGFIGNTFGRHALPMVWDYAEVNVFSDSTGKWIGAVDWIFRCFSTLPRNVLQGKISQLDVAKANYNKTPIISTDPPYYDNIGYADLSDYFYVWMRRSLKNIYPDIFSTLLVPKTNELIASPYRHENKQGAEQFFMDGMTRAIRNMADKGNSEYPTAIYYAFKQAEIKESGLVSTGWATFLEAVVKSGYSIDGTWPIRTERTGRLIAKGTNSLASSIILVCRPRDPKAPLATRREFIDELRNSLPEALETLQQTNIAPVDMQQAAIGPGMAIYSKYSKVISADGSQLSVGDALVIINEELDKFFEATEGDMDGYSRFCITWFQEHCFNEGLFGQAEIATKTRNISVDGLVNAGVVKAGVGKVRLLRPEELEEAWDPREDERLTLWECTHHLCRALRSEGGEAAAGALVTAMGSGVAEEARSLAYRLYSICDRKGWTQEAQLYNDLVMSWDGIKASMPQTGYFT